MSGRTLPWSTCAPAAASIHDSSQFFSIHDRGSQPYRYVQHCQKHGCALGTNKRYSQAVGSPLAGPPIESTTEIRPVQSDHPMTKPEISQPYSPVKLGASPGQLKPQTNAILKEATSSSRNSPFDGFSEIDGITIPFIYVYRSFYTCVKPAISNSIGAGVAMTREMRQEAGFPWQRRKQFHRAGWYRRLKVQADPRRHLITRGLRLQCQGWSARIAWRWREALGVGSQSR